MITNKQKTTQKARKPCPKLSPTSALSGPAYPSTAPVYLLECCWSLAPRCNRTLPGRPGWSPPQGLAAGLSLERSESPAPPPTPCQRAQQPHRHTTQTKQNGRRYWKETAAEGRQLRTLRKGKERSGLSEFKHKEVKDRSQKKRNQLFILQQVHDPDGGTQLLLSVPGSARIPWRTPSSNNIQAVHLKHLHMNSSDEAQYWNEPQQMKAKLRGVRSNLLKDKAGIRV